MISKSNLDQSEGNLLGPKELHAKKPWQTPRVIVSAVMPNTSKTFSPTESPGSNSALGPVS